MKQIQYVYVFVWDKQFDILLAGSEQKPIDEFADKHDEAIYLCCVSPYIARVHYISHWK
jgi:hypothetical protein